MKKTFDKLNRIIFIAGIVALIILVLIIANSDNDVIDGVWGTVSGVCLLVIFLFGIFATISVILAIVDGVKKDKVAFLKKFFSNVIWIATAYIVVYGFDYFRDVAVLEEFKLNKFLLQIFVTTLAVIGGEYMFTDHNKKEKDELHF